MEASLYTPAEIVQRNPILLKRDWTAQNIGYLFKLQLVDGVRKSRCAYIDEVSVLRLFYSHFPTLLKI